MESKMPNVYGSHHADPFSLGQEHNSLYTLKARLIRVFLHLAAVYKGMMGSLATVHGGH
jgi:hypothetical protein